MPSVKPLHLTLRNGLDGANYAIAQLHRVFRGVRLAIGLEVKVQHGDYLLRVDDPVGNLSLNFDRLIIRRLQVEDKRRLLGVDREGRNRTRGSVIEEAKSLTLGTGLTVGSLDHKVGRIGFEVGWQTWRRSLLVSYRDKGVKHESVERTRIVYSQDWRALG